jgi:hypothetical protein
MRRLISLCALAAIGLAPAALAAPSVRIRGAAVRVVVQPEDRRDILITVLHAAPGLRIRMTRFAGRSFITGDFAHKVRGCRPVAGRSSVQLWGRGDVDYNDLPQLLVRMPLDARIFANGAVFGAVGRSRSLELVNQGCGDWTVANVADQLKVNQAGSGEVRMGAAGRASLNVSGSGSLLAQAIAGAVTAVSNSSGDITLGSVGGNLDARVAGSGSIHALAGSVPSLTASVAGSGSVRFDGVSERLNASIAGPGDVIVSRVTGKVTRRVFGPGAIRVGSGSGPAVDRR